MRLPSAALHPPKVSQKRSVMNASVRLSDFYNAAAGSTIGLHRRTPKPNPFSPAMKVRACAHVDGDDGDDGGDGGHGGEEHARTGRGDLLAIRGGPCPIALGVVRSAYCRAGPVRPHHRARLHPQPPAHRRPRNRVTRWRAPLLPASTTLSRAQAVKPVAQKQQAKNSPHQVHEPPREPGWLLVHPQFGAIAASLVGVCCGTPKGAAPSRYGTMSTCRCATG